MKSAEQLLALADELEARVNEIKTTGAEWAHEVEMHATRIEKTDYWAAAWLRRIWSPAEGRRVVDTIRLHVRTGDLDTAEQCVSRFEVNWRHARELVVTAVAQRGRVRVDGPPQRHNKVVHAARSAEWARWNNEAAKVWEKHPAWKKLPVAQAVKKNLKLPDEVRTIRARINKTGEAH